MVRRGRLFLAAVLVAGLALASGALSAAAALELPSDPVVLTITGPVEHANSASGAAFSMRMLAALPQQKVFTKSPWYPEGAEFTGPLLRDVLRAAGAKGKRLTAFALNDYQTEIPFDDALRFNLVLAHQMNGQPMPVRDKGPLFLVYPFDAEPALRSQVYYNRSAWQLVRLKVD